MLEAIAELAHELRPQPSTEHADEPDASLLHAHGRLDARTLAQTRALAWREIVDPLRVELGAEMAFERRTRAQPSRRPWRTHPRQSVAGSSPILPRRQA